MFIPEIFQYDFMIRAFMAGLVISVVSPLIGMFMVARRYSLIGDTLAHVSLVGVAIGLAASINPILTAVLTSVIAAIGIERLRAARKIFGESVLAIFLSGSLAVASVIVSAAKGFNVNFYSFLFGSITTVQPQDLYWISGLGLIVLGTIIFSYRYLFAISYDEVVAKAGGLNVERIGLLLVVMTAVTISLSMRIVGALLIGALIVIPTVTAIQFRQGFKKTTWLAVIFSVVSVVSGLFISFYLDLASGGTIIVTTLVLFILSLLVAGRK